MAGNDELATRFFEDGERIAAAVTVQKSPMEIAQSWAGLTNLPLLVEGLQSVGPAPGGMFEFKLTPDAKDAGGEDFVTEILKNEPGRVLAWRSTGQTAVPNAGSITLRELPFARGTEVKVVIEYIPPKGPLRQKLDKALGRNPKSLLQLALFRFRQLLEAGEIATTKGQPAGRGDGRDEQGSGDEKKLAKAEGQL